MDYKIRIAVCDDDKKDCFEIVHMAGKVLQEEGISHSISVYENAKMLLEDIQKGQQFHIMLLDVLMEEMDGIELAAELRKQQNKAAIIFVSVSMEMALRGYEVAAARYLSKPLDEEKLKEALLYCHRGIQEKKEILLPTISGRYRTSLSDIQFIEAFDRGTRFVLTGDRVDTRVKISEAENMMPAGAFVLCHRAYIVNLACVKYIRHYEFELKSGLTVPISKGRYAEVYKKFAAYITD